MSGDEQHYTPRFLLKGFASTVFSRKRVEVWYFSKDYPEGSEKNTRKVGCETQFYGNPLDDLITKKEDKYALCLDRIRKEKQLDPSDKQEIAEFVYTMSARTRYIREDYAAIFRSVTKRYRPIVTDSQAFIQWTREDFKKNNNRYLDQITQGIQEKLGLAQNPVAETFLRKLVSRYVEQNIDSVAKKQVSSNRLLFSILPGQIGEITAKGHRQGLTQVFEQIPNDPTPALRYYQGLQWKVQHFASGTLILGDVGVLQVKQDTSIVASATGGIKGQGNMFLLPLSHDLLIIGGAPGSPQLPLPDAINRAAAELSLDFFVASRKSEQEIEYAQLLGQRGPDRMSGEEKLS